MTGGYAHLKVMLPKSWTEEYGSSSMMLMCEKQAWIRWKIESNKCDFTKVQGFLLQATEQQFF